MKRSVLAIAMLLFTMPSFAQGMFGAQAGLGYTTAYKGHITPAFEGYYLHKAIPHLYAGGSLFIQKYSLLNEVKKDAVANYGDIISIRQKSTYAFISAKVDYGIGYRQYVHISLAFGPGFYLGGSQYTNQYLPYPTGSSGNAFGADTMAVNTTYNIPAVIFRGALGISERIPTHGYWNITLSQEFSLIPGNLSKSGPAMNTGYFAFQVGIMHKYPLVFVEY